MHTLEDEIQLIKGYEKSLNSINRLSGSNERKSFGIYVEIKNPSFHYLNEKNNFSEIVLKVIEKYYKNTKESNVYIQCFDPNELK